VSREASRHRLGGAADATGGTSAGRKSVCSDSLRALADLPQCIRSVHVTA